MLQKAILFFYTNGYPEGRQHSKNLWYDFNIFWQLHKSKWFVVNWLKKQNIIMILHICD